LSKLSSSNEINKQTKNETQRPKNQYNTSKKANNSLSQLNRNNPFGKLVFSLYESKKKDSL